MSKRLTGAVKWFNEQKGYGFITPDDPNVNQSKDVFVHISSVERAGWRTLKDGQRVEFEMQEDRKGKMAAVDLRDSDTAKAA